MIEHPDGTRRPVLSVVIVVFAGGRAIKRVLEALERQEGVTGAVEIIVAMPPGLVNEQTVHSGAPAARLVRGPAGAHPAELRALGVRLAAAPIIACTEDHCMPTRDWCARILDAHRSSALVIGGAIQKLQPDTPVAWAAYLMEYGRFMPPVVAGPAPYLSDCNVSYKRSALEAIAVEWQGAGGGRSTRRVCTTRFANEPVTTRSYWIRRSPLCSRGGRTWRPFSASASRTGGCSRVFARHSTAENSACYMRLAR